MNSQSQFKQLPWTCTSNGSPRRVGVEIEMGGMELETMAKAVQREFGGTVETCDAFVTVVRDTDFGDFRVELDTQVLKNQEYRDHLRRLGIELNAETLSQLERWLADAAGLLVPHEIVAPPLPIDALPRMDRVHAALQKSGARGTHSSLLYAFGMQLNIEVHDLSAAWISSILRAFSAALPSAGQGRKHRSVTEIFAIHPLVFRQLHT